MNAPSLLLPNEPGRFDKPDFHRLLEHAKAIEASDIHIRTLSKIICRVHGKMVPVTTRRLEEAEVGGLSRILYGADNAELEVRTGKPLDGAYQLKLPTRGNALRYRWNATGCEVAGSFGIKLTLRELPQLPPALQREDFAPEVLDALFPHDGLVLICGATGSGKSTLMAGIIRAKAEDPESHSNILTYEAPIEFTFDKVEMETCMVTQTAVPHNLKSFPLAVNNALRGDPDIIVVGEARDAETIKASVQAAQTGHAVYTTVHSNTVGSTFLRLIQALPPEEAASALGSIIDSIRLVVCQRLYPSTDGKRVAVRETLVFDHHIRRELLSAAVRNLSELPAAADRLVRRFGQTMLEHADQRVKEGRLDSMYAELLRIDEQRGHPSASDSATEFMAGPVTDGPGLRIKEDAVPLSPAAAHKAWRDSVSESMRLEPDTIMVDEATDSGLATAVQHPTDDFTFDEAVKAGTHLLLLPYCPETPLPLPPPKSTEELAPEIEDPLLVEEEEALPVAVAEAVERSPLDLPRERASAVISTLVVHQGEHPAFAVRRALLAELCDALACRLESDSPDLSVVHLASLFIRTLHDVPVAMRHKKWIQLQRHLEVTSDVLAPRLAGESEFLKRNSNGEEVPEWSLVRNARALISEQYPLHDREVSYAAT